MAHVQWLKLHGRLTVRMGLLIIILAGDMRSVAIVTTLVTESHAQSKDASRSPAQWERFVERRYENKGVAKIERLGGRWVLSILCQGTHTAYLDEPASNLARYLDQYVAVRYDYIDRLVADPRCVRAPCGPTTERRILLERITPLQITHEEAIERDRRCK
jgi:hypothetical protein